MKITNFLADKILSYEKTEPPEGMPCACGQVFWHRRNLTQCALDGAYCDCPIFIPSYESTAAKCRLCGKPPRSNTNRYRTLNIR